MKQAWLGIVDRNREEVVANFGGAQIVKLLHGKLEIREGNETEKAQAHDWMKRLRTRGPLTVRRVR